MENGQFIGARFESFSAHLLHLYAKALGLENPLPVDKIHVTIMYSKTNPNQPYPLILGDLLIPVKTQKLVYIGNALAITLRSPWLQWRRDLALACGMRSKFGSYLCHVSLAYDPPKNLILQNAPPLPQDLLLISEYSEPLKPMK